jgi:hypothetical protein
MRAYELLEYRRAGELYPKQSAIDILRKYKDRDDVFVSFTKLDKLGINPLNIHNTPIGIYAYPLKSAWQEYQIEHNGIKEGFPYASGQPYIWIFSCDNVTEIPFMTEKQYEDAKTKLISFGIDEKDIKKFEETAGRVRIGEKFWKLVRNFSRDSTGVIDTLKWTGLLIKLGYNAFSDKTGWGVIHTCEKVQAIFFKKNQITILEKIHNINPKTDDEVSIIRKKRSKFDKMSDGELMDHFRYYTLDDFKYLTSPSEEVVKHCINRKGSLIRYVRNPSEEIQLLAVKSDNGSIQFIEHPTEQVQLESVTGYGGNICYIKNPSIYVQKAAIKNDPSVINLCHRSLPLQWYLINKSLEYIRHIAQPYEEIQMHVVKENPLLFHKIRKPTRKVIDYIINLK